MSLHCLSFEKVSFGFESSAELLLRDLSIRFTAGWCGIIGPNGSGKTTVLRLAAGELEPVSGSIAGIESVVQCPQRTDDPPEMFSDFLKSSEPDAFRLRGRLRIDPSWISRWSTLSHGERKRAQIATALWRRPDLLAIDEPTNHIDADARDLLMAALRTYKGVGLLVSHDRELLDELCDRTLFMEPPTAILRPGGYSDAVALAQADQKRLRKEQQIAADEVKRLRVETAARQNTARQADRKRSLKGGSNSDSDAQIGR